MNNRAGDVASNQFNRTTYAISETEINDELDKELERQQKLKRKFMIENAALERKLKEETEKRQRDINKKVATSNEKDKIELRKKLEDKLNKDLAAQRKKLTLKLIKEEFAERAKQLEEEASIYGKSLTNSLKTSYAKWQASGGFSSDLKALGNNVLNIGKKIISEGTKSVDTAMNMYAGVYSKMNARLQGSNKSAKGIFDLMNKNLASSPYVSYQDMLNNTASLIQQGIAYNVEERAFLMTIKDKIADTFDVANGTLLLIIRIQQQDSTRARLGMEASLTSFLNSNFLDTSYLSDVYDTVTTAVADSVVQLGTKGGAEYEYLMQKWLGSLYSMGISSNTVTNLASAINMLATGDVAGLQGSSMQNLLVMAANKSGMNYGDLLTHGVNADNVNALMSNVVSYWTELALNRNQVVRKQYAGLFGLDMSDLVAIRNVDQELMTKLAKNTNLSYSGMESELLTLLSQVGSRMHVSELINNAYSNVVQGIGRNIANSPGMMATWLINSMIKDATGGINIPFITAMGSGVGLETNLNSIVQLGMVGAGTLGLISNIIAGLNSNGGLNLSAWNASDMNTRGGGLGGVVTGVRSSTSATTFVGNANSSDIYSSTLNAAYDNVDKSVTNETQEQADELKDAIVKHIDPNIEAILNLLRTVSGGNYLRVKVEDYGLVSPFN